MVNTPDGKFTAEVTLKIRLPLRSSVPALAFRDPPFEKATVVPLRVPSNCEKELAALRAVVTVPSFEMMDPVKQPPPVTLLGAQGPPRKPVTFEAPVNRTFPVTLNLVSEIPCGDLMPTLPTMLPVKNRALANCPSTANWSAGPNPEKSARQGREISTVPARTTAAV